MTMNYDDPNNFEPTATYTTLNPYFVEAARLTALPNLEVVDKAFLRVTGMEGVRPALNTMKEKLLQKDMRRLGEDTGSDDTYYDIELTTSGETGAAPYRLAMVDSDFIHTIAVGRGYTPIPRIGVVAIPDEIVLTVPTALGAYAAAYDSVLWEVNIDDGGWTTDEFDDETILTPEITIASGSEAIIRLTVTNEFGSNVHEKTIVLTS
ncbi:hypothetical protein [Vibrio campbellii]|uniref:hypothetical protein n=1 Tax=Vibrio campbellii TaxID=680 RepID=UPI002499C590|nr:hypothetical protein [Vibrio campbellii]